MAEVVGSVNVGDFWNPKELVDRPGAVGDLDEACHEESGRWIGHRLRGVGLTVTACELLEPS